MGGQENHLRAERDQWRQREAELYDCNAAPGEPSKECRQTRGRLCYKCMEAQRDQLLEALRKIETLPWPGTDSRHEYVFQVRDIAGNASKRAALKVVDA